MAIAAGSVTAGRGGVSLTQGVSAGARARSPLRARSTRACLSGTERHMRNLLSEGD